MLGDRPTTGLGRTFGRPTGITPQERVREGLHEARRQRQDDDAATEEQETPFFAWAVKVPEPKRPLDLVRFAFQVELYSDAMEFDRDAVIRKGTQLGISAWLIRWALRWADKGRTVLYIMPRERHATEFSDLRIEPVIKASGYLRSRYGGEVDGVATKRLKAIGAGYLALRGSTSKDELDSVDADALALDEYDRLVQANIPDAEQRVTGPLSEGLIRRVSTPTVPGFGISKAFDKSDRRTWHVRCPKCDRWQAIRGGETLLRQVDRERMLLVCEDMDCREPLDVRQGEWVAEFPDRDVRGYHIPKFVVPGANIAQVVANSEATSPIERTTHHNKDLGEPYLDESAGLTQSQILAAVRPYRMVQGYAGYKLVTMGVDVASARALNVRISEHVDEHTKRALWIGLVDDGRAPWGPAPGKSAFEIVAMCMAIFRVHMAVIDQEPNGRLVRAFQARFPGRSWRCAFSTTQKEILKADGKEGLVVVRRTEAIDSAFDLVRNQANVLPEDRPEDYDRAMRSLMLQVDRNAEGKVVQRWVSNGDPEDYAMAETYDVVATHMAYAQQVAGTSSTLEGTIEAAPEDAIDFTTPDDDEWSPGLDTDDPLGGWG